ncbi:uncharacterized protein LOC126964419 [Leptidea sinapis]|uniref:uncharacterized protein LOC126964419 n=1 Tax=Leptidea sinapis TaxID=189913 RepID=UPI0021429303|nr:uncharacterized protein LOC126964419 [Leptidea sinapis]
METNLDFCSLTGSTISQKTMEDGNTGSARDDRTTSTFGSFYGDKTSKVTTNGHDFAGEPSIPSENSYEPRRHSADATQDDKCKKRINPLRIHLGKRPFVDNSVPYNNTNKKKKPCIPKTNDTYANKTTNPRIPKLIPKRLDHSQYNATSQQMDSVHENEQDKPVPRLVPKSQLLQFKKNKIEKVSQLKEYAQSLGLQPMVKFKCRKCYSMTFKTLEMLKKHQLICRGQAKQPMSCPEGVTQTDGQSSGPSRVTRKVYLCSACGTYYENWNLFLHMREVHNRHICLFCLGMFSKAEKLSAHLINKHNVHYLNYNSKEDFTNDYNGSYYLMCCMCDEICSEKDDFFNHDCNNVKPKPVPVLISKNSLKTNNSLKNVKETTSGPVMTKEMQKPVTDNIKDNDQICDTVPTHIPKTSTQYIHNPDFVNSDTSIGSSNSLNESKDTSNTADSAIEMESPNYKHPSPTENVLEYIPPLNGDEKVHSGLDSCNLRQTTDLQSYTSDPEVPKMQDNHPLAPEKECGIKLKLSLSSAKSPVIINSTVDPSVGQQYSQANKPPSRNRRPPKRYEKEKPPDVAPQLKTPSIKMTICDKADSPFVKTTFYENHKQSIVKTLVNNNCEPPYDILDSKPENNLKSTIYDNKIEDVNTLNRVPKLTVRVPKEFLDKASSSDDSSDSDSSEKLTVDENNTFTHEVIKEENDIIDKNLEEPYTSSMPPNKEVTEESHNEIQEEYNETPDDKVQMPEITTNDQLSPKVETTSEGQDQDANGEINVEDITPTDASPAIELTLDEPIDKYPLKDLMKVFLLKTFFNCIYCNHARKIAVNCEQLALHMVAQHKFSATVNSITAEELLPETISAKIKAGVEEVASVFINLDSYDSVDKCETVQYSQIFECFQCYFKTAVHKELYLHNRKMHQKTIMLCIMCKNNFYTYSELLCHLCPGTYNSDYVIKFRCCFCNVDSISSSFRLMVHLRKIHHTCDVCLEFCQSQARLSNHVWKHKLHHLCFRCGIAYRNKPDINNHLFWKHGTESVMCKRCLQKKWPHVYHFCIPPAIFACEECNLQFTRAVYLKVHKRFHSGEYPHVCTEEDCTEKFVSKKILNKHIDEHKKKLITETIDDNQTAMNNKFDDKDQIPVIDLICESKNEPGSSEVKVEPEMVTKRSKKKKLKDKDALLLDVNLPALNLSESDSSDESDGESKTLGPKEESQDKVFDDAQTDTSNEKEKPEVIKTENIETHETKLELEKDEKDKENIEDDKSSEQQVLQIWDNLQKYHANNFEPQKEKTPPPTRRRHVCESDHDYCVIPADFLINEDVLNSEKKKNKKSPKKRHGDMSSSSSSSSDSDSSCSCGSNCSCSSSSGSSSSSSSDSDSSDDSGNEEHNARKMKKVSRKNISARRMSNGSNVDVMGMTETPVLIAEKNEPTIAETDLETEESDTDEEFYDENPQQLANKLYNEKRNQLLSSITPSDGGSVSEEVSRCTTPVKEEVEPKEVENKEKSSSSKKKSKKKKKSRSSKKHGPIKLNIPKGVILPEPEPATPLIPNKITISLQSNTVHLQEAPKTQNPTATNLKATQSSIERKRASKRRRVPNKFYGYSSDDEASTPAALKPQLPPKLEWRKEDLPSPAPHKTKKEIPSTVIPQTFFNFNEPIRLTAPVPDPEPPRILMNTESMESSEEDTSDEGALEIYQPTVQNTSTLPPPTYLNSGTSSLPYPFQRPPVRQAKEGESVYCYCRCPYDEVSEMIACDAEGCPIEWFHFECVGIMVPPKGKWYCPECRKNQNFSGYR